MKPTKLHYAARHGESYYKTIENLLKIIATYKNLYTDDFLIYNKQKNWILVKNEFNKLIGLGGFIMQKMKKQINLRFGSHQLMHTWESF